MERGEIASIDAIDLVGDLVTGPLVSRLLRVPRLPEESAAAQARDTADRLLPFLLRALGAEPAHAPAGAEADG